MNKKISFPIAITIIIVLAVLVGGVTVWWYLKIPKEIETSAWEKIPLPRKPITKIKIVPEAVTEVKMGPRIEIEKTSLFPITTDEPKGKGENDKIPSLCDEYKKGESELRVYDSQRRVTGLVNGEIKVEIPSSFYYTEQEVKTVEGIELFPAEVIIFEPEDSYVYEIFGLTEGNYKLDTSCILEGKEEVIFSAENIPILPGVTHRYQLDWEALAQGKDGATLYVDADGDGIFEKRINADTELTCEEFIQQIGLP